MQDLLLVSIHLSYLCDVKAQSQPVYIYISLSLCKDDGWPPMGGGPLPRVWWEKVV